MKSNSVLIVGCGDLGARTAALLLPEGWQIAGVRRDVAKLPPGVRGYAANYTVPGSLDFLGELQPDYVVMTCNPTDRSVAGYQAGFATATANVLAGLGRHRPRHVIAVSSTRVFAEGQGAWIDESSPLSRDDPRAVAMIDAEQLLLESAHPATVIRFAGIYGTPGGRLLSRLATGELCSCEPPRYSNRIHRDDCAGFLAHLLRLSNAGGELAPVYIGVDDHPALQYDVESWLAGELGVTVQPGSAAPPGPSAHKRCCNRRLHDSGYTLLYPDYRSGYGAAMALSPDR